MEPTEQLPIGADPEAGDTGLNAPEGGEQSHAPDYVTVAKEKGWRPKEEFDGEVDSWVDAEEFIKRQPLFDKIKTQSKKLKELERTVEAMAKHYNESITQAKQRMLNELKAERREAIELGEVTKVEELDTRMSEIASAPEPPKPGAVLAPEIEQFVDDHKDWFNKDDDMTSFAVAFNESYLKRHPGDLAKSLEETLKAVKKAYPEKFVNRRRESAPPVEGSTPSGKGNDKYSFGRLSPEQKLVYNQLVKQHKTLTHEQYFRDLDEAGYLN